MPWIHSTASRRIHSSRSDGWPTFAAGPLRGARSHQLFSFPPTRHALTFQIISWAHWREPCHWPCETCRSVFFAAWYGSGGGGASELLWFVYSFLFFFSNSPPVPGARVHYAVKEPNTDIYEWVSDTFLYSTTTDLLFDTIFVLDLLQMCGTWVPRSSKMEWRGHHRGWSGGLLYHVPQTFYGSYSQQWSGRFLGIIAWDPGVCKSNRLHVDILRFSSIKLGYILL